MQIEATKKLFTVDDYYRMAEFGILSPEDRVELIDGEIIEMSPMGTRHISCVMRATQAFSGAFKGKAMVSVQLPLRLSNYTEPEPDLTLLKSRADFYAAQKPAAKDAYLVLEVSDTTLDFDRNVKLPRYAAAGILEVWIANLQEDLLLVYREPSGNSYKTNRILRRGDPISVAAFPEVVFKVEDFLG